MLDLLAIQRSHRCGEREVDAARKPCSWVVKTRRGLCNLLLSMCATALAAQIVFDKRNQCGPHMKKMQPTE